MTGWVWVLDISMLTHYACSIVRCNCVLLVAAVDKRRHAVIYGQVTVGVWGVGEYKGGRFVRRLTPPQLPQTALKAVQRQLGPKYCKIWQCQLGSRCPHPPPE